MLKSLINLASTRKKLCAIALVILVLSMFSCGKKKQQEQAPNLEDSTPKTETTQADTVFSSDEDMTSDTQTDETEAASSKQTKEYKFIPKGTKDFKATGNYRVQLISLTNYDKILSIKQKLKNGGYATTLSTTEKNGKTFYRLRLASLYTKNDANKIGNKIKNNFKFITGFWIQKTK